MSKLKAHASTSWLTAKLSRGHVWSGLGANPESAQFGRNMLFFLHHDWRQDDLIFSLKMSRFQAQVCKSKKGYGPSTLRPSRISSHRWRLWSKCSCTFLSHCATCRQLGSTCLQWRWRPQRPYGLLRMGSPGRSPRIFHTAPEFWCEVITDYNDRPRLRSRLKMHFRMRSWHAKL